MGSRSIIVLGVLATFSIVFIVAISMGYANNNFLFQDGSTPLTDDWDAGAFRITSAGLTSSDGIIITRTNPNNFLRLIDSDTDDELRIWVTGGGIFQIQVWDESETTLRGVINLNPSDGFFRIDKLAVSLTFYSIDSGSITITSSFCRVDTQDDDATDDLDTITAETLTQGSIIILRTQVSARDVTVKDNTGNIQLAGNVDFTLDHVRDRLMLQYDTDGNVWVELSRSNNN